LLFPWSGAREGVESVKFDKTLDIKGLAGARPQSVAGDTLANMAEGQILMIITNDAAAKQAMDSLCRIMGYDLLDIREDGGTIYIIIRK